MTREKLVQELERLSKASSRVLVVNDGNGGEYTVDALTLKNGTDINVWDCHMTADNDQYHVSVTLENITDIHRLSHETICLWIAGGTSVYIRQ